MSSYLNTLSDKVKGHLAQLVINAGLQDREDSLEIMAKAWIEKLDSFNNQVENRDMEELKEFNKLDERGALLITYSGSLICLGPLEDKYRKVGYTSIGLRTDVPENAVEKKSELLVDVEVDKAAEFITGPIKKSSAIYKIAVVNENLEAKEQIALLADVTQVLTDDFVEVNKTIIM